jgi:uncharacterized protein (TIGR04255 family)
MVGKGKIMMKALEIFTAQELGEVFPFPPIREVAFEIKFAPRLRVNAELWKLQDRLVEEYPIVTTESVFQPNGAVLNVNVFENSSAARIIKVSHENFVIAFTKYNCFEDFKEEVIQKAKLFCSTFEVVALTRVGLRYVNNIILPAAEPTSSLLRFVRPLTDFDRVDIDSVEQFLNEVRMRYRDHLVTVRGVLLPPLEDRKRIYILDIDCHSAATETADRVPNLLDAYHDSGQRFFLDHVTEELKQLMRRKK